VQDIEALRNHLIAKEEGTTAAIKAISELQAKRDLTLIDRFNAAKEAWKQKFIAQPSEPSKTESQGFGYKDYAVGGVCVILSMLFVKAADVRIAQSYWIQQQQQVGALQARSTIEQTNAQTQAAIAQAYSQNQVAVPLSQYVLTDYRLDYTQPPIGIDWARSFDPTVRTQIFDQNRSCVGVVQNGAFTFVLDDPTVCAN